MKEEWKNGRLEDWKVGRLGDARLVLISGKGQPE